MMLRYRGDDDDVLPTYIDMGCIDVTELET